MAELFTLPARATDADGGTLSGALLHFYATGGTTPAAVYTSNALSVAHANPVVADSGGKFAAIYLDPNVVYRAVLKTAAGVTVTDTDPINTVASDASWRTLAQYGAIGDGSTNDRAAIAAADADGPFLVSDGSYKVASNLTISSDVTFSQGGKLVVPSGVTVTINGQITAAATQIFDTTAGGSVVIDGRRTPTGWAEWWGLTAESAGAAAANVAAINAAITALRETCLQARTYYTNAQISLTVAGKRLLGSGHQYDGTTEGRVTRIICTSATAHILYMGATSFSSIAALPRGIFASDLFLTRSVGPDVTSGCSGVLAKWSLFSGMERIKTDNCVYGFQFGGNVHFKGIDLHTNRSTAGTGGTDIFYGYFVDGSVNIGANGGNASLYLIRCNAEGGIAISNSVGFYADQKMTDLFIHYPETSNFTTGIELNGPASNTTLNYDTIDVEILAPKLDTFGFAGIYIHGMNKYGSVEIKGGYYGAASGATAAINVVDNLAAVRIDGGQMLMGVSSSCFGIRVKDSGNVMIDGTMISEADAYAVVLDGAANCRVMPFVKNHSAVTDAAVALLNTCTGNYIAPMVSGGANKVAIGIQAVGTGDARNEYNCTGIDSACINGGSGNKLVRNSVQITAAFTLTGTNTTSGVMT